MWRWRRPILAHWLRFSQAASWFSVKTPTQQTDYHSPTVARHFLVHLGLYKKENPWTFSFLSCAACFSAECRRWLLRRCIFRERTKAQMHFVCEFSLLLAWLQLWKCILPAVTRLCWLLLFIEVHSELILKTLHTLSGSHRMEPRAARPVPSRRPTERAIPLARCLAAIRCCWMQPTCKANTPVHLHSNKNKNEKRHSNSKNIHESDFPLDSNTRIVNSTQ